MGGEGPTIAIIRGLKVRVPVLDRFLNANGVDETYGLAPFYDIDPDQQSRLLRSKVGGGDTRTRIFVPSKLGRNETNFAYVAWAWEMVYAQKEILLDQHLPTNPPTGWAAMRDEILSFSHDTDSNWNAAGHGKTGLFVVVSDERPYFPLSFLQQNTPPIHCDQCEATFDLFRKRQEHRRLEHGIDEGSNPLPDND
ncbi:hypothetical protein J7T55_011025 [Diaporthe amygdali]|uniref:uncharacterized protein n=1 Tax=Phomopsis amygdali TaxID=1214568 RepID=UPI0022FF278D|nr:uncharacterized protein J7T55_011025 [Diaporthe amygdali]KAJ0106930.1 hypothetical protein J7T55_011025 [Diaporthe amygdali]